MRKVFAGMLRFLSSMFALGVRARCVFGFLNVHQWRFALRMDVKPIKYKQECLRRKIGFKEGINYS